MSEITGNVLIVDDDKDVLQAAELYLKKYCQRVTTESDPNNIHRIINENSYDVILLDMNFTQDVSSGKEGFLWLSKILDIDPSAVVILITAYGDIEMAVQAIKAGAVDFVLKPWQNEKLLATINAGINLRRSKLEAASSKSREKQLAADLDYKYNGIVGQSEPIQNVLISIAKFAKTDANILLLGESGTGKELVAREIHRKSNRTDQVFISVDMGAITESLFESELFGHVKGAFTDAKQERAGRFEIANKGTLFLDEIGNISPNLQVKLLSAIQNKTVAKVGSYKELPVDVRLISATNMDISGMIERDEFRQDLLYRINTIEIKLPPLRDRFEDIHVLVNHFTAIYAKKYNKTIYSASSAAIKQLKKYSWPGNIRELKHAIERAVIMCESDTLSPKDFFITKPQSKTSSLTLNTFILDDVEREVIKRVLIKNDSNISMAAKELGLTRASLYRRIQKHEL